VDWKKVSGSKKFRIAAAGAGGLVTLGAAAAAVAASLVPANGVINACYDNRSGAMRLLATSGDSCHKGESGVSWNQQGPIGPAGATGASGPAGTSGKDGRDGLAGVQGPAGATGAQGVQGPQGVQGAQGPAGETGSGTGGVVSDASSCNGSNGVAYATGQVRPIELFMAITGIQGEALDKAHEGEIVVQSFTWGGIVNTGSVSGGGASSGRAKACPVNVVKVSTDKATPAILKAAASGEHIEEVTLSLVKPSGGFSFTFAKYKFSDVLITNGGDSLNFVFNKVEVTYTPQRANGTPDASVVFGWDFASNKGV
jgi:type VI secretion system Hcp family effector